MNRVSAPEKLPSSISYQLKSQLRSAGAESPGSRGARVSWGFCWALLFLGAFDD